MPVVRFAIPARQPASSSPSSSVAFYVHSDHKAIALGYNKTIILRRRAQDGHLDFHTAPELCRTKSS